MDKFGKKVSKQITHFICLPLVTKTSIPQLQDSLRRFRSVSTALDSQHPTTRSDQKDNTHQEDGDVHSQSSLGNLAVSTGHSWTDENLRIIPRSAHQALGKYHLTLGVMDLSEESEMQRARELLASLDLQAMLKAAERDDALVEAKKRQRGQQQQQDPSVPETLARPVSPPSAATTKPATSAAQREDEAPPAALTIALSGLGAFPSAQGARVFWAKPHETSSVTGGEEKSSRLYMFSLLVRQRFREAGFITETRPLKLHATVANIREPVRLRGGRTIKGRNSSVSGQQRQADGTVDARGLIEVFDRQAGDVQRAENVIREQHDPEVVERGAEDVGTNLGEYVWAQGVEIDRVALCKLGADKIQDEALEGEWYPHLAEKMIFED